MKRNGHRVPARGIEMSFPARPDCSEERDVGLYRLAFVLFVACATVAVGCRKQADPTQRVTVEYEITPQPPHVGDSVILLRLKNSSGQPLVGARISVEAGMSHAGMSPVFAEAKESEPGRYHSRLSFEMAGDWVILLHGTLPSGEKLERQFDVPGVRSN